MTTEPSFHFFQSPQLSEFFIARQPILGRDQDLVAYELLFRHKAVDDAEIIDDLCATASVIEHAAQLGIENVIGHALAFFNVDAAVLMCDFVRFLPPEKVVLEILETVQVTPDLIKRVEELAAAGFAFALDDVVAYSTDMRKLMPHVKIIKIDINNMERSSLAELAHRFKKEGKLILAEKVETTEQFQYCLALGFDYFQGYYFAKPDVLSGKKLDPSKTAIIQLLALLLSDAQSSDIEHSIRQDASLSATLLHLANAFKGESRKRIDSLEEALEALGRRQLHRWLHIILYAGAGDGSQSVSPLLLMATSRGKLMELIAERLYPDDRNIAGTAFTIGVMSLIDVLFGEPMQQILSKFPVSEEIRESLLDRTGLYGDLLTLVEQLEPPVQPAPKLPALLRKLHLSIDDLYSLQLAAFKWSNSIGRASH